MMSSFKQLSKLCLIPLRCTPTTFACIQRIRCIPFAAFHSKYQFVSTAQHRVRGIAALKQEHIRIKTTMQSFERMLDRVQNESHSSNTVSKQHLIDLHNFLKFCRNYNMHHHNKEELMFERARNRDTAPLLQKLCEDHKYGAQLYQLMETSTEQIEREEADEEDKVNALDDVMIPSKSFIHMLYQHMHEEDNVIYPKLQESFSEQEMEEIAQEFDDMDYKQDDVINAMEFLSDELNQKYHQ